MDVLESRVVDAFEDEERRELGVLVEEDVPLDEVGDRGIDLVRDELGCRN